ncbi:unnamed protein product [Arctia plantaginis]|uniref:Odorant receptor n=1 Tax=Arctia plantaginis TaxID=874455 RepID=A0A8S1BQF8_ARCPL|nr:unnamed protein product [Arctia plantaginis]
MMGLFVKNINASLRFCLSVLKFVGFLKPIEPVSFYGKVFYNIYWFSWFMFLAGGIIIAQSGAMFQIWGDLTLMTSASFLLFTNLAFATKAINVVMKRRAIQEIINTSDDELTAEDRMEGIEIVKRYPYDTSKSPAYEVTYVNQLMLCKEDETVQKRIKQCVVKHQAALKTAAQIQTCFTKPILAQFSVSVVIICVTAYQLALSCKIAGAAYWCPWYLCSVRLRRELLIVMQRTRHVTKLTAGGFTTLSLDCFTSIIKASYTFFTVLKQVEDRNEK